MHRLWPQNSTFPQVDDDELERLYDYPAQPQHPWVQVNFVSSADGAVTIAGHSAGLSSPGDKRIFRLGRDLADVILVGAGTALTEGYHGVKPSEVSADRRARFGLSALPTIAVVTNQCSITVDSPLLTNTPVPPLIVTCTSAPVDRRAALERAGAEILLAGAEHVDLARALAMLGARGLRRVCCEGGPQLFGSLIEHDLVDQLCLTIAPLLVGGQAGRIAAGSAMTVPVPLTLDSVLQADGSLLVRYRRYKS